MANSTNLSIESGLAASNVAFEIGFEGVFGGNQQLPGAYTFYSDVRTGANTEFTYLEMLANYPQAREWVGPRRIQLFRAYEQQIKLKTYEVTTSVPRKTLQYRDRIGAVGKTLTDWLAGQKVAFDRTAFQAYLSAAGAGPTCYDGAALFSASHPHSGAGGNQSNIGAAANLNASTLETAVTAMSSLTLENGEPAGFQPNILMVGPALARRAKALVGADVRVITIDANGKLDAVSSAVAAATGPNMFNGEMTLVVDTRRIGAVAGTTVSYFWDLIDNSRPGIKPMIKTVGMALEPTILNQPDSDNMFWRDNVIYGMKGDWSDDAYDWHCCYRGTGTA
jgi:phage major head subunit gpT-like protein